MPAFNFKSIEQLKVEIKGWTIQEVISASRTQIVFRITHPLAEHPVALILDCEVTMGRSGNVVIATELLKISAKDILEEKPV